MKPRRRRWGWSLIVNWFLIAVAPASAAQINVVWTSEVGQFAPLWVTKEAKLFEKYGNQVELIFIQGASSAAAATATSTFTYDFFMLHLSL